MEACIGTKIVLAQPMDKANAVMAGLVRDATVTIASDGTSPAGVSLPLC